MGRIVSRQTRQSFQPARARRLTEWASITTVAAINIAAGSDLLLTSLTAADLSPLVPATLVRVRGEMVFSSDQNSADEIQIGSYGIGVVQDAARAAGPPSIPSSLVDAGDDLWLNWQSMMTRGEGGAGTVIGSTPKTYTLDAKAMRKIVDGEAIIVAVSNHSATTGIQVMFQARFLFLLH